MAMSTKLAPPAGPQGPSSGPTKTSTPVARSAANGAFANVSPTTGRITTETSPLTLMNGMTAGYGDGDGNITNPVPARGEIGRVPKGRNILRSGVMRTVGPVATSGGKKAQFSMYFMFNPNQIITSFGFDPSVYPSNATYAQIDGQIPVPIPGAANNQSVSWSLLFDRTYDMFKDPKNRGTLRDIAALYNILGAFTNAGIPMVNSVEVIFGRTETGQIWGFTGYLSAITITHGIFRYNMIPVRTEVDLTLTAYYVNSQAAAGNGNGGIGAGSPGKLTPSMHAGPVGPQGPPSTPVKGPPTFRVPAPVEVGR